MAAAILVFVASREARVSITMPILVLGTGGTTLIVLARWLMQRGVPSMPIMRRRGVNLIATRGPGPTIWLCAHLDSKSQPIPTLVRSIGIVLLALGYLSALAIAVVTTIGARDIHLAWPVTNALTLVSAVPVVLSMVGSRSHGAADNASGVATVLRAAELHGGNVGVLITDAEELGLAGARAWTGNPDVDAMWVGDPRLDDATVLNCDTVDDDGAIQVMYSGLRPGVLADAVTRATGTTGGSARVRRMLPGVLTDTVAFQDAGVDSVTFSRGTMRTLARIHTSRDDLQHLRGTGIAETATLMAETARQLRGN